ncbi:MAG: circadian clock KaiB family protein [Chryseolinea sp.]
MASKISVKSKPIKPGDNGNYDLRLFVTGALPNSARAIINISSICEKYLKGNYKLEVIDIYQQPELALADDVIAVPMLIKKSPLPEARMAGDLSDTKTVLENLLIDDSKIHG